jgi:hypothetical protein
LILAILSVSFSLDFETLSELAFSFMLAAKDTGGSSASTLGRFEIISFLAYLKKSDIMLRLSCS